MDTARERATARYWRMSQRLLKDPADDTALAILVVIADCTGPDTAHLSRSAMGSLAAIQTRANAALASAL